MLMGMGADELFAGYSRHRNAFRRNGSTALLNVLQQDLAKIPYRNLGRDNRVKHLVINYNLAITS